jgi:DNA repair protein RadD
MTDLRPYQTEVIAGLDREHVTGKRRILMVAPTASGKTLIAAAIIKRAIEEFKDVLVLAHRREIIGQTSRKLFDQGIAHGIIQAGMEKLLRPMERVQVASVQTLTARAVRSNRMELPKAKLLVIDEAHHTPASTYRKIIEAYPEATLLGLTATPCRGDGRGLGGIFETIVKTPQVAELIEGGFLVRTRVYAPVMPDLKGVRIQAGDFNERQLAERMDRPKLIGDIVTHWLKYGEKRRTVAFAVSVGHSIHLRDEFSKSGVRAEHIDATTPKPEREATLARLASGVIEIVTNCMVLTEGWDMPEVGACILARPTRKMGLYRQMIGRVLRPAPNKPDAIVLDHSGAVFRHGFAEDHVDWTLDPDRRAESASHQERGEYGSSSKLLECSQCPAPSAKAARRAFTADSCRRSRRRTSSSATASLGWSMASAGSRRTSTIRPRAQWHAMLTYIARQRGYNPKWPMVNYKKKFGTWPPWGTIANPEPPTPEVLSWVRSRIVVEIPPEAAAGNEALAVVQGISLRSATRPCGPAKGR